MKPNTIKQLAALLSSVIILFVINISPANAQDINSYFQKIRNNEAELTAFFSQMPKGGDLHNHLSGAIYAETYVDFVVQKDYYINTTTLQVLEKPLAGKEWARFSTLAENGTQADYIARLMQKWSVKDYNYVSYPSDKLFFETFPLFDIASKNTVDTGLIELKNRAKSEHVSYLEIMTGIYGDKDVKLPALPLDNSLEQAQQNRDTALASRILDTIFNSIITKVKPIALNNDKYIFDLHWKHAIDDSDFTMRYLFAFSRIGKPSIIFKKMLLAFEAVALDTSNLVVGVNIVAPENNDVSMHDYWLHMQMFKYLHSKAQFSMVKYSLHAGELALGMVKPEELTWHINAAVYTAGANRIGHGVDLPYENNPYELLNYMAQHKIAIEINLFSNEFILKVSGDRHPIMLYKRFNVPIVISTDDAGVLRSNLIEQYVLLASRYKDISYADIKQFVYNSITYSFIKKPALKERLKLQLDNQFSEFEQKVLATGH